MLDSVTRPPQPLGGRPLALRAEPTASSTPLCGSAPREGHTQGPGHLRRRPLPGGSHTAAEPPFHGSASEVCLHPQKAKPSLQASSHHQVLCQFSTETCYSAKLQQLAFQLLREQFPPEDTEEDAHGWGVGGRSGGVTLSKVSWVAAGKGTPCVSSQSPRKKRGTARTSGWRWEVCPSSPLQRAEGAEEGSQVGASWRGAREPRRGAEGIYHTWCGPARDGAQAR